MITFQMAMFSEVNTVDFVLLIMSLFTFAIYIVGYNVCAV